jgi:hypothetical protein
MANQGRENTMRPNTTASAQRPGGGAGRIIGLSSATLLVAGFLIWQGTTTLCFGCAQDALQVLFDLFLVVVLGGPPLIGAIILVLTSATRRKEWLTLALMTLIAAAIVICVGLLVNYWDVEQEHSYYWGISLASASYLSLTGWSLTFAILALPALTLLYGLWRDYHVRLLRSALGGALVALITLTTLSWVDMPATVRIELSHHAAPIVLSLADGPAVDCASGVYPDVVISDVGTVGMYWTASASADFPLTIQPSNDSVAPGQQVSLSISGARPPTSHASQTVVTIIEPYFSPPPVPSQTITIHC